MAAQCGPDLTLVAPDLRGRADSVGVPGPWGVARHADDLALLLDAEGLERRWESVEDLLDYFTTTTAPFLDRGDPLLRHYLEHDLRDGRVRRSGDALVGDATDIFFGEGAWERVPQPIRFLRAEWSVGRDTPPAYAVADLERYAAVTERTVTLDGVDHAASIMSPRGATATAELVREALA